MMIPSATHQRPEFECSSCETPLELADVTTKDGDILPPAHRLCWKCQAEYDKAMRERDDEEWDER